MFALSVQAAQSGFFDRQVVMDAVTRAERKNLSQFGAFVRTRAKQSIRQRKKPAPAGSPPSSHTGLLGQFIYFSYDQQRNSVVIGPTRLDSKAGTAPGALEQGGTSTMIVRRRGEKKPIQISIAPHPYMGPAFEQEQSRIRPIWTDSIQR